MFLICVGDLGALFGGEGVWALSPNALAPKPRSQTIKLTLNGFDGL